MPAINGKLLDKIIRFQVDLRRMEAGTRKKALETLQSLQKELVKELSKPDDISSLPKYKINEILSNISPILIEHYSQIDSDVQADIDGVAKLEVKEAANALKETVFVNLEVNAPTKAVIDRLSNPLVQGGPMSGWWNRQRDTLKFKFGNEVRQGILLGETNQQIIQRIVGKGDIPGIMRIARNDAAALVHTSVHQVANDARQAVYDQNSDVIKSYVWFTALDSHVCWSPDTLITMSDGSKKKAGDIREGDYVTGGVTGNPCKVLFAKRRLVESSIEIHYNGRFIGNVTNDHPILTPNGWKKASDICLPTNIQERQVLCRNINKRKKTVNGASAESGIWNGFCGFERVEEVWGTGCINNRFSVDSEARVLFGEGIYQGEKHESTEWVQYDGWWGRCLRFISRNIQRKWKEVFAKIQDGRRVQGKDESCHEAWREEGRRDKEKIQLHSRGTGYYKSKDRGGVEAEGSREKQSKSGATRNKTGAERNDNRTLENKRISRESKFSEREEAGGTKSIRQRLGEEKSRKNVEHNERKVGERSGISEENGIASSPNYFCGVKGEGRHEEKSIYDARETGSYSGENAPTMGKKEDVTVGYITGITSNVPCEVVTLTIEDDPTYVAGGIIVHNCKLCMGRSGLKWRNNADKTPINHSIPFQIPPIHYNDRCVLLPETLTFEELGIDSPEIPASTRASSFGQVDANITFDQYLSRLPKTTQDDMLGVGRAQLWRDGKISLSQLLDGRGRELTLAQLEEKYL